jgi:tRNA threonylcarbamoyl adenosine modification protein YeaZ
VSERAFLAFDTSGAVGSVAVGRGSEVLARASLDDRNEHAAHLVPAVEKALQRAQLRPSDLDGVVVGEGPGSFTGVRVAAATAKGLVRALDIPLWAFSSLAAAALAEDAGPVRYVLFDARHDRVYGACYRVDGSTCAELVGPHPGTLAETLRGPVPQGAVFVGEASRRHRGSIETAGYEVGAGPSRALAEALLHLVESGEGALPVADVGAWEPRYVRLPNVERAWNA